LATVSPLSLENQPGTYVLILQLDRARSLSAGRLDKATFPAGFYAYTGSAFGPGGLKARIGRHWQRHKRPHWHIDTLRRFARIVEIWYTLHPEKVECRWARLLQHTRGAVVIAPGFGASDCRCRTHLFYFTRKPGIRTFRRNVDIPVRCRGVYP
jgi:Uri superfamily endonuclease